MLETINVPQDGLRDHIVIAGGGRVGQYVASILTQLQVPFVIIDMNHRTIEDCTQRGYSAIYGDASQGTVLGAANLAAAKQILITIPHIATTETIVHFVKTHCPALRIVVRSGGAEQMEALYSDGVHMVIRPELEGGIEIARQVLLNLKFPVPIIQKITDSARQDHYQQLSDDDINLDDLRGLQSARDLLELKWEELVADSSLVGNSLRQLDMRRNTGSSVVGVLRDGVFMANPSADLVFETGDMIATIESSQYCDWPGAGEAVSTE